MYKTLQSNNIRNSYILFLILLFTSCTQYQGEVKRVEEIEIAFQGKTRRMIPVNYNNNKCICIEEVFQDSINLRIFNLKNGNELLTIKHPKPFDWFLRSGLKNHLLFSERNGNFILLNLDTKTTDYYKASDFGIINRDFFTLRSFSPDGTYLVADFKETKENEMLTMENTISGYKLFSEESLLVELSLENGALKFNDTITYGFKKKLFWGGRWIWFVIHIY